MYKSIDKSKYLWLDGHPREPKSDNNKVKQREQLQTVENCGEQQQLAAKSDE